MDDMKDEKNDTVDKPVENEKTTENKVDEVDSLKKEISELKDKYLRILAEFENFKRRSKQEQIESSYYIEASLLKDFLSVNDDFERALSVESKDNEGLRLIKSKFEEIFKKRGVTKIKTSVGDEFDMKIHEAISTTDVDNRELDGKIAQVFEDAFLFNSKVLRFAKVIIGHYKEK